VKVKKNEDMVSILVGDLYEKGEPCPSFRRRLPPASSGVVQVVVLTPAADKVSYSYELRLGGRVRERREETIKVDWQPMNFGGVRPYLWCPRCEKRRVTELFVDEGELVCRVCARIAYPSQSEPRHQNDIRRAHLIREQLGGLALTGQPFGPKPPGMHRRTYADLCDKAQGLEGRALRDIGLLIEMGWEPRGRRQAEYPPLEPRPESIIDFRAGLREVLEARLNQLESESEFERGDAAEEVTERGGPPGLPA
jgi:hypothetical protein